MKKKSLTLCLLLLSALGLMAQNYVAPPPLLPNPAHGNNSGNNPPLNQPVYAPESTNNPVNNPVIQTPGVKTHLIKKGESLYRIAKMYNVTVDDIKMWNYLQSDLISVGSSLSIGALAPYVANTTSNVPAQYNQLTERSVPGWLNGTQNHTVLAGESLASIATHYGLTEARLRAMNNLGAQNSVPPGYIINVNPCGAYTTNNPPPVSYEQSNNSGVNYSNSNTSGQDYSSPIPRYMPQDRPAETNNVPNAYNYAGNTNNNPGNYTYRREDQYDPNPANSSAIPNSYEYSARGGVPDNNTPNNFSYGGMIYENGKRVHVVGNNDTLETIADQYQVSADRLRVLNKMGAYDIVRPNQKLLLE